MMSWVLAGHLIMVDSVRPRMSFPALAKRGPLAWDNALTDYKKGVDNFDTRLNIHAVDTKTAEKYLDEVEIFLRNAKMHRISLRRAEDVDAAMSRELNDRCFLLRQPFGRGAYCFFGLLHLAP